MSPLTYNNIITDYYLLVLIVNYRYLSILIKNRNNSILGIFLVNHSFISNMNRFLSTILFSISILSYNKPLNMTYSSYCVMDGNSLEVLEGVNIHKRRSVASISKIMTAILVLENENLFDVVTVGNIIKTIEGSAIYVEIGDEITVLDLVYGLLLRSGNDAAVLLAEHMCDKISDFVSLMNKKAIELGMNDTTFNNPTGLDVYDDGNLSTTYDMCLLMSYCMDNKLFYDIASTKYYTCPLKGRWKNKNKLLFERDEVIIGKTGYTKKAKRTLITGKEKDYQRIVICTLNYGDDFSFHKQKYDEYYSSYFYIICLYKGDNYILDYYIYSDKIVGKRVKIEKNTSYIIYYYLQSDGKVNIEIKSSS